MAAKLNIRSNAWLIAALIVAVTAATLLAMGRPLIEALEAMQEADA